MSHPSTRGGLASVLAALICLIGLMRHAAAINVVIPLHDQLCFHEDLKLGENVTILYQVAEGNNLEIDFWVTNPRRTTIHIAKRDVTGQYEIRSILEGRYQYCFSNKVNSNSERVVQFGVQRQEISTVDKIKDVMGPVEDQLEKLDLHIRTIRSEQAFLSARERTHRRTAHSSNSRVSLWTAIQLVVLIAVSYFQIRYLKHFFENKRIL